MSTTAYPPNGAPRNEVALSARRFVNDEVARIASSFDGNDGSLFEFVCECGDLGCKELVKMTLHAYGRAEPGSVVGHRLLGESKSPDAS